MPIIQFAFDKQTSRSRDSDGRMRVKNCILSTAEVNPYNGKEIPGWDKLGLDPNKVYHLYRTPEALRESVPTHEGSPIMVKHIANTASEPNHEYKGGSVHTIRFDGKHLRGDLLIDDGRAIDLVESGEQSDLSAGYRYVPVMTSGKTPEGHAYDGIMTKIEGNHVALVDDGRATGAHVADAAHQPVNGDAAVPNPIAQNVQKKEEHINPQQNPNANGEQPGSAAQPAPGSPQGEQNEQSNLAAVGQALKHIAELLENIHSRLPGGDTDMPNANDRRAHDIEHEAEDRKRAHDEELRKRYSEDKRRRAYDAEHEKLGEEEREAEDRKRAHDEEMENRKSEDERRRAYDEAFPDEGEQEGTPARGEPTPHGAMDANTVNALVSAAVKKERQRNEAIQTAKRDVAPVLGDVDGYAFDSADGIYREALKAVGVDLHAISAGTERAAWSAYRAATSQVRAPAYAQDSNSAGAGAANQKHLASLVSRIAVKG